MPGIHSPVQIMLLLPFDLSFPKVISECLDEGVPQKSCLSHVALPCMELIF